MSNIYLEKLMRKPTPKIEKGGFIIFDVNKDEQIEPDKDKDEQIEPDKDKDEQIEPDKDKDEQIEPDKDKDEDEDEAPNDNFETPLLFKIIDKRDQANIDRNLIIERLYNRGVMNYEEINKEAENDVELDIETINKPVKKKRIIISDNQIDKVFDETEEEIQPKTVKNQKNHGKNRFYCSII